MCLPNAASQLLFALVLILWTALSLALGIEIRGEVIRGTPCIKRFHQLFCPTAGNSYPMESIERFIDENKALMKRMYGEFQLRTPAPAAQYGPPTTQYGPPSIQPNRNIKRDSPEEPFPQAGVDGGPRIRLTLENVDATSEPYFTRVRKIRQSFNDTQTGSTGRIDACEAKVEVMTPFWASNSGGKVRAVVNTQHFEQAIHQEVCKNEKSTTKRCNGDCGCEQKFKWHRLLAYDPDNDCKGIFMDWFMFPSCCVCRCNPIFGI